MDHYSSKAGVLQRQSRGWGVDNINGWRNVLLENALQIECFSSKKGSLALTESGKCDNHDVIGDGIVIIKFHHSLLPFGFDGL
jgi:hypothetical protein